MKTIKLSQASRPLAEYAADLRDEIVVLTERNRVVAAIVPLKKADRESVALSGHPEFLKIIERSRADFRRGRVISLEAMKNELKVRLRYPDAGVVMRGSIRRRLIRRFPYGLLYRVTSTEIRILAVMNLKRRPAYSVGRS